MSLVTATYREVCPESITKVIGDPVDPLACGPTDVNCNDPEFALQNPDKCGDPVTIILKPAIATVLVGATVQYATYAVINGGQEILLLEGLVYLSSGTGIATVDADDGLATGVVPGIVTISVTWHGLSAFAQLTVVDDCADVNVGIVLVIDNSRSMGLSFSTSYTTRLAFIKAVAAGFVPTVDIVKDSVWLNYFNIVLVNSYPFTTSIPTTVGQINAIPQSDGLTDITKGMDDAIALLDGAAVDNKVIILFSDGEQRDNGVSDPTVNAGIFKAAGGIIICVGARASGSGYDLLSEMSSPGYLLNGLPSNETTIADLLSGLKGYFCAGTCITGEVGYGDGCLEIPPGAQSPDPTPLPDVEPEGDDGGGDDDTWSYTSTFTAECPPGSFGNPATRSATYTSTISQADAEARAKAAARAAAYAALVCCKSAPILIKDFQVADPYPACMQLTGPVNITALQVKINGLTHGCLSDLDIMLVGPTGLSIMLMSDVCASNPSSACTAVNNVTLTFADGSPALPSSGAVVTGSYSPTDYSALAGEMPDPAPDTPSDNTLAAFNGTDATGTWQLYVFDDTALDTGSIVSWELVINGDATGCDCANTDPTPPAQVQIDDYSPQFTTAVSACGDCDSMSDPWDGVFDQIGSTCNYQITGTTLYLGSYWKSLNGKAVQGNIRLYAGPNGSCYHELVLTCIQNASPSPIGKVIWVGRKYGIGSVDGNYIRVAIPTGYPSTIVPCSALPWSVTVSAV